MKKIFIKNKCVKLDDLDYKFVRRFSWCLWVSPDKKIWYAHNKRLGAMHRFLMGYPRTLVDHCNGDGLDNRMENLRVSTHAENMRNRRISKGKYKGVFARRNATHISYFAYIRSAGKQYHLGTFSTAALAAAAYNLAAKKFHGKFASLNRV